MKPFDETDLAAYHLGELPQGRARALEQALKTDTSLAEESRLYASMLHSFKGHAPLDVDEDAVEHNWQRIRYQLPRLPLQPRFLPRYVVALAATGLALAAVFMYVHPPAPFATPTPPQRSAPLAATAPQPAHQQTTDTSAASPLQHHGSSSGTPYHDKPQAARGAKDPGITPHYAPPPVKARPLNTAQIEPPPMPASLPASSAVPSSRDVVSISPQAEASAVASHRKVRSLNGAEHATDLTVAVGGVLIPTRNLNKGATTQGVGASHALSALASFHQQFRPLAGYRVTASYNHPDYDFDNGNYGGAHFRGRTFEVAGTYVVQGPRRGFLSTTVEAGAGFITILPTSGLTSASTTRRAAAIVGTTANVALSRHLAVQAGYRLQIFRAPDSQLGGNTFQLPTPVAASTLLSNEPSVGITYRFSGK